MIKLHHSPLSRSVRILWLLEELGIPFELVSAPLEDPEAGPFVQKTPWGKFPAIEDGETVMFESGAILEYLIERYGEGRLAPALDAPNRGAYLQWIHFAESTAFPGLGNIAWHTRVRKDADEMPAAIEDYRGWAEAAVATVEGALEGHVFILGEAFSGADIMLGYTLMIAKAFGALTTEHPRSDAYLARLLERPGFRAALRS